MPDDPILVSRAADGHFDRLSRPAYEDTPEWRGLWEALEAVHARLMAEPTGNCTRLMAETENGADPVEGQPRSLPAAR